MISALARGGLRARTSRRYTGRARTAAAFIRDQLYDAKSHELSRRYRDGPADVAGFLDDYAFYIQSLLDLYEATLDVQWLTLALDLQATQDRCSATQGRRLLHDARRRRQPARAA